MAACVASTQGSREWIVVAVFWAAAVICLLRADIRWERRRLEAWARREKLEIVSRQRRVWRRGPFDPLGQYLVFRIRVRDAEGKEKDGWVRLGSWFWGPWSDEAEARWDPPS
jgi:hypothetical protein